jgi:hypothetical protein
VRGGHGERSDHAYRQQSAHGRSPCRLQHRVPLQAEDQSHTG